MQKRATLGALKTVKAIHCLAFFRAPKVALFCFSRPPLALWAQLLVRHIPIAPSATAEIAMGYFQSPSGLSLPNVSKSKNAKVESVALWFFS